MNLQSRLSQLSHPLQGTEAAIVRVPRGGAVRRLAFDAHRWAPQPTPQQAERDEEFFVGDAAVVRLVRVLVKALVFGARQALQILQAIVRLDAVAVVDVFTRRHGPVRCLPNQNMLGAVSAIGADQDVAVAVHDATALPIARLITAKEARVMAVDKAQGIPGVLAASDRGDLSPRRFLAASTFTEAGRGSPVRRRLGAGRFLHLAVRPSARPMTPDELCGSSRVQRARNNGLTAAASACVRHNNSLPRLRKD